MGVYTAMKTDPVKPNYHALAATCKLAVMELEKRGCEIQSISIINHVRITISKPTAFAKLSGEQVEIHGGVEIHGIRETEFFGACVRWGE